MADSQDVNLWTSAEHALEYLRRADTIPHRTEGEAALLECLPAAVGRVLDVGSGGGRLLGLVHLARPSAHAVALDFSPVMLSQLRERFGTDGRVEVVEHDLDRRLPELGKFDAVVSSFAIHHLSHPRKRELYAEIFERLLPGGRFCNLEHVSSPTAGMHARFLELMGIAPGGEDPSNKLLDVETQLRWLREIGFGEVDCYWKWSELALLIGQKPPAATK